MFYICGGGGGDEVNGVTWTHSGWMFFHNTHISQSLHGSTSS
jgi:hypothetical protein